MYDPSNAEIAASLERFGQLLEIAGDDPFRSRAYLRAADGLRRAMEPVTVLLAEDRLTEVDGIGAGIAAAIRSLLASGELEGERELGHRVPSSVLELLTVPGVGTKTAARLFHELGIVDLDALETAVQANRIRSLPGLGPRSEERIQAGIAELRRRSGRTRLGIALPIARQQVAAIEGALPGARVAIAGSVRRMEETVGNIDIVVGAPDPDTAIATLVMRPGLSALRDGDRSVRYSVGGMMDVRIRVVGMDDFGTELLRATGPTAHLALLPPSLSAHPDEADVYAALGLAWIPLPHDVERW